MTNGFIDVLIDIDSTDGKYCLTGIEDSMRLKGLPAIAQLRHGAQIKAQPSTKQATIVITGDKKVVRAVDKAAKTFGENKTAILWASGKKAPFTDNVNVVTQQQFDAAGELTTWQSFADLSPQLTLSENVYVPETLWDYLILSGKYPV